MKCCLLSTNLESGGAERQIVQLAKHWPADEVPPEIVLLERQGPWLAEVPDRIAVRALFDRLPRGVLATTRLPGAVKRLRRVLSSGGYDAVVAFLWLPAVLAAQALRPSRAARHPRLVYSVQSDLERDFRLHRDGVMRRAWVRHSLPEAVDAYFPLSRGIAQRTACLLQVSEDLFTVIPNGTEIARVRAQAEKGEVDARTGAPRIVSVGRLHPAKGYADLLEALALLRDRGMAFDCDVLGEGPMRGALERRLRRLRLVDRVKLPGHAANPYAWLRSADVFVSSSRWETFGIAMLEAMALGLPVAATRTDGAVDLIEDGLTGRLADVGDPPAMAGVLETLLTDEASRARLGAAAAREALAYDAPIIAKRFVDAVRTAVDPNQEAR